MRGIGGNSLVPFSPYDRRRGVGLVHRHRVGMPAESLSSQRHSLTQVCCAPWLKVMVRGPNGSGVSGGIVEEGLLSRSGVGGEEGVEESDGILALSLGGDQRARQHAV